MATRFYFVAFAVGGLPPVIPTFQGTWEDASQGVWRNMTLSKNATTEVISGVTAGDPGSNTAALGLISPPLTAQTISGTLSISSRARELAATDNLNQRYRMVYLVNSAGTFQDTLLTFATSGTSTELSTTVSAQRHAQTTAFTTQNANDGDYLVIEYGYGETTLGSTPAYQTTLGGSGTDQTNTDNDTTGQVPWAEFSQDLTFQSLTAPSDVINTTSRPLRRLLVR